MKDERTTDRLMMSASVEAVEELIPDGYACVVIVMKMPTQDTINEPHRPMIAGNIREGHVDMLLKQAAATWGNRRRIGPGRG